MRQFTERIEDGGRGDDAALVDPKLARKEAVNDMKREHIMYAAIRVIIRDGYMNARLEDIAEEAGFSKAAIYHYFPDKEAILVHIMLREQRADYERFLEAVSRELPFMEFVRVFVTVLFEDKVLDNCNAAGGAPISAMSNLMVTMSKHDSLMFEAIKYKFGIHELMTRAVKKARADGTLSIPVDDAAVCFMIMSFVNTVFMGKTFSAWVKGFPAAKIPDMPDGEASGAVDKSIQKFEKVDSNWVFNALAVFLEPWVKDSNFNRRWYDVQQKP